MAVNGDSATRSERLRRKRLCAYKGCNVNGGKIEKGTTAYMTADNEAYHIMCYGRTNPVTIRYSRKPGGGSGAKNQGTGNRHLRAKQTR